LAASPLIGKYSHHKTQKKTITMNDQAIKMPKLKSKNPVKTLGQFSLVPIRHDNLTVGRLDMYTTGFQLCKGKDLIIHMLINQFHLFT
jgi:hypothetical protein